MDFHNKELFFTFKLQHSESLSNPFIYYYPGCSKTLFSKTKEICSICYNDISYTKVSPDSCTHFFCKNCLSNWKKYRPTCPLCRSRFNQIKFY